MSAIRTTMPASGEVPSWEAHWISPDSVWDRAAQEVCELSEPVRLAVGSYLVWRADDSSPASEEPRWYSQLDWAWLKRDLTKSHTTLTASEQALARAALGLATGGGEVAYRTLLTAGLLVQVLDIAGNAAVSPHDRPA